MTRRALLIVAALLLGCHPRLPAHRVTTTTDGAPCPKTMALPSARDVCDGLFTRTGLACVRCAAPACVDQTDVVYCIRGTDCGADPLCSSADPSISRATQ
jgi:hypothetical protein